MLFEGFQIHKNHPSKHPNRRVLVTPYYYKSGPPNPGAGWLQYNRLVAGLSARLWLLVAEGVLLFHKFSLRQRPKSTRKRKEIGTSKIPLWQAQFFLTFWKTPLEDPPWNVLFIPNKPTLPDPPNGTELLPQKRFGGGTSLRRPEVKERRDE